jgi:hypothetical protein
MKKLLFVLGLLMMSCSADPPSKKKTPILPVQFVEIQDTDKDWYGIKTLRNEDDHVSCYVLYMNDMRAGFQCIKDAK